MESFSETSHFSRLAEIKDTNEAEVFCYKGSNTDLFFLIAIEEALSLKGTPQMRWGGPKVEAQLYGN